MRIVYLIAGTFNAGGMERVLTNKANWLVQHGYEVAIITTDQRGRAPYFSLHPAIQTYDLSINYDTDNGHLISKLIRFPFKQWRHRRRLTALLKQIKADITICMFNNDVSFAYKIKDGSRKFLEIHFSKQKKLQYHRRGLWRLADLLRTRLEQQWVRHYEHFVVLTHEDKALWGDLPNICVIPNARTFTSAVPADLHSHQVLAVGRMDYQKGFDRLIDIWKSVHEVQEAQEVLQEWQLVIVGDGPLRHELQKQVEQLGLLESVQILQPTSDIQSLYVHSSIVVLTSRYEGLPMVLLEAQAFGLPIVAFACQCGPRDIITDGVDGYLIPDGDNNLFAERLGQLMESEELRNRMGTQARKASEQFNEELVMKKWEDVFVNL